MKKDNPMLKKALEEAARQELSSLPEERQIIRPYSDKFEKDMQTLLGKADTAVKRKRPRVRVAALIAAVLVIVLTVGTVGAAFGFKTFSPEWRESIKNNVLNASTGEEVEAFDKALAESDDLFAKASIKRDDDTDILMDYSETYNIDVIEEKDGYRFYLDSVVKAQTKRLRVVGGSIADGTAEFAFVIEDDYYLIAEVSRVDGKAITEEEIWFDGSLVVADYNPNRTHACMRTGIVKDVYEDGKIYYAISITEAMIFADHLLGATFIENIYEAGFITNDIAYIDENGLPEFKDTVEGTNLVIGFSIDEKFADKKAAEEYAEMYYWYNSFGGFEFKK